MEYDFSYNSIEVDEMNFKLSLLSALVCFSASTANSATIPLSQGMDNRIQTTKYTPKDVVTVMTKVGRVTLIQLEDGETILNEADSGLGMGDPQAWGLALRGNNIFLKPQAENPNTNLIVVSDKGRTYTFDLITVDEKLKSAYQIKFTYPMPKYKTSLSTIKNKKVPCSDGNLNFSYYKWGDSELSPKYVWDDGRFTCFKFEDNVELPTIYNKSVQGEEGLVNYSMNQDVLVVHSVSNEFRLRLGDSVMGIKTNELKPQGFNKKATSVNGQRVVKHNG